MALNIWATQNAVQSGAGAPQTVDGVTKDGSNPLQIDSTGHNFANGDLVYFLDVGGTTELNGNSYTVENDQTNAFDLASTDSSNFTAWTSGGSANHAQDFVHGSETDVPVAALHVVGRSTVINTAIANGGISLGFTDGTDERAIAFSADDITGNTDTNGRQWPDVEFGYTFDASGAVDGENVHVGFVAGGERTATINSYSAARLVTSIFFAGCNAKVLTATLNGTTPDNVDPGFAWTTVIIIGAASGSENASLSPAQMFMGFYDKTTHGGIMWNSQTGQSVANPNLRIGTTYAGGEISDATGALEYGISISAASGTSADIVSSAVSITDVVYCLFLGVTTGETMSVQNWQTPTSTGDQTALSGLSFQPQAMISLFSFGAVLDTAESDADAGSVGISLVTDGEEFCTSLNDEDGVGTNTQGMVGDSGIDLPIDDGTESTTTSFLATLGNSGDGVFESGGAVFNWTNTDTGTAREVMSLVIGNDTITSLPSFHAARRGVARGVARGIG